MAVTLCNACHGHDNDRIHIRDDRITYQCVFSDVLQDCLIKEEDKIPLENSVTPDDIPLRI